MTCSHSFPMVAQVESLRPGKCSAGIGITHGAEKSNPGGDTEAKDDDIEQVICLHPVGAVQCGWQWSVILLLVSH